MYHDFEGDNLVLHPGGESLVEPEVVPPLHCHEVTEPHVCQFMQVHIVVNKVGFVRPLILWFEYTICESDCTYILHCTDTELGTVDHIILGKWEFVAEEFVIECNTILDSAEYLF